MSHKAPSFPKTWEPGDFLTAFFTSASPRKPKHSPSRLRTESQKPGASLVVATLQLMFSNTFLPMQKFHILKDTLFAGTHAYAHTEAEPWTVKTVWTLILDFRAWTLQSVPNSRVDKNMTALLLQYYKNCICRQTKKRRWWRANNTRKGIHSILLNFRERKIQVKGIILII